MIKIEKLNENDIFALYDPEPLLKFSFDDDYEYASCFFLKGKCFEEKQMTLRKKVVNGQNLFVLSARREHVIIYVTDIYKPQRSLVVMFLQKRDKVLKYSFHANYECCRVGSCFFVSLT